MKFNGYQLRTVLGLMSLIMTISCSKGEPAASSNLTAEISMSLERDSSITPNPIIIRIQAPQKVDLRIEASEGSMSSIEEVNGEYRATLNPKNPSGEIRISASYTADNKTYQVSKTALVLPEIESSWGQPQAVEGLVNTAGYEDGAEISSDGEYLIVSSYSPVDMACCITGCGLETPLDPSSKFCQSALGPSAAPERPQMPGAERILSSTRILNSCPQLCIESETNDLLLIPSASYLFQRQSDGSFANPQVIGVDGGGCLPTQGFSFTKSSTPKIPEVVFAFDLPDETAKHDIYWASLKPDSKNHFARYYCDAGTISLDLSSLSKDARVLGANPFIDKGNPSLGPNLLFWDSEKQSPNMLYFASFSGTLPLATFSNSEPLPVGNLALDRRQPYFHNSRLYFAQVEGSSRIVSTQLLSPDAANAKSWSPLRYELAPELNQGPLANRTGAIVEIGEPSISNRADESERLYFVYYVWTGNGFNSQVGFVERKDQNTK